METNEFGFNFDHSYSRLPSSLYSLVQPAKVPRPEIVIFNEPLAELLGLDPAALSSAAGAAVLSGNRVPEWALPLAQAYAGHQFGYFTMLGDGRALLLGEQIAPSGQRWDLQLKGTGPTPYSRGGDGKATMGPMRREYIISETMHALGFPTRRTMRPLPRRTILSVAMDALGLPTSRSLAVVATGELVPRETLLPGAILARVAQSHIRVGTSQYAAAFAPDALQKLADYTLERH